MSKPNETQGNNTPAPTVVTVAKEVDPTPVAVVDPNANPRVWEYRPGAWIFNARVMAMDLATNTTIIPAGTLMSKNGAGRLQVYNGTDTNVALYVLTQDSQVGTDAVTVMYKGEVIRQRLLHGATPWENILDRLLLQSQITPIEGVTE